MLLVLSVMNYAIYDKEKTIDKGSLLLLKLAPVDPRSLMQGDYMRLNYEITQNDFYDSVPNRGYLVVKLDQNNVAQKVRYQPEQQPVSAGEYAIKYYHGDWRVQIGAESYFFEEGQAAAFDSAKYGALKLSPKGQVLLIGLYDNQLKPIVAQK